MRRDLTERPVLEVGRPILMEEWWLQQKQKGLVLVLVLLPVLLLVLP